MPERRAYPRVPCSHPVTISAGSIIGTGWSVDLTPMGVLVEVDDELLVSGPVTVRFEGPTALRGLRVNATVVRASAGSHGRVGLGIRFVNMSRTVCEALHRVCYQAEPGLSHQAVA